MTDVSITVMSLLTATGLLLVALKHAPLSAGRSLVFAGVAVLCAHAIGLRIVAPIEQDTADAADWITLLLMVGICIFVAGRGLVRTLRGNKPATAGRVS